MIGGLDLPKGQRSAQQLAPTIKTLLGENALHAADIALVAVAVGPGSFTGLRVGVTTAKTFAYSANCDVLGVNTLQVIACRYPHTVKRLSVTMDAQRGELFVAEFCREDLASVPNMTRETQIASRANWLARLDGGCVVTGPGLEKLLDEIPKEIEIADRSIWHPKATHVGWVASQLYVTGHRSDKWILAPEYFRKSAAEEKAAG